VAAEESSVVRLPTTPPQRLTCPPALTHFVLFGTFFPMSSCHLDLKTYRIACCCGPSSHFVRVPKDLAHGYQLASVFICETAAPTSFTVVFKLPQPFDTVTGRGRFF